MKAYKTEEVAEILNCHVETVKKILNKGQLKGIKVGSEWRVPEPNLVEYMGLVANNYKSERELELERQVEELKKLLAQKDQAISVIKNEILRIS